MDITIVGMICVFAGLVAGTLLGLLCGVKLHAWALRERLRRRAAIFNRYPI